MNKNKAFEWIADLIQTHA